MIVRRPRTKATDLPPSTDGIIRVDSMNVLGIILQKDLSFQDHAERLASQCAQNLYALKTLRSHGLAGPQLWDVTKATLVSRISYASQAWWGLLDAGSRNRLEACLNKVKKQGFLPPSHPSFTEICDKADDVLFSAVLHNPHHVLHPLLPPVKTATYNLRPRAHNRVIPNDKNTIFRKTFIMKMLNLNSY